ncbi:hypothetical protein EH240_33175 [Mesorhizobium tamadayense]|uniref:Plasmid pRiA4b Orf3-like domain-containing protein n=1 Tax=Mesorhizobium tamadayense TaxID=425306 RepID=A0A3P3EUZ2_9HYPH|nr:hypothetical protein EH240_33175 [Mesorhizobium tamadayense]
MYDFGDNWQHTIAFEKSEPAVERGAYPVCIRVSAIVRRKIAAASGVIRNCWPSWPIPAIPNTPNASKSSATSSIRTNSPLTSQMPHLPPGSG